MSTGKKDFGSPKFTVSKTIIRKDEEHGENRENLFPELNLSPHSESKGKSKVCPKTTFHGEMSRWDNFFTVLELISSC